MLMQVLKVKRCMILNSRHQVSFISQFLLWLVPAKLNNLFPTLMTILLKMVTLHTVMTATGWPMELISLPIVMMTTRGTPKLVVVPNLISNLNLTVTLKVNNPMRSKGKGGPIWGKVWKGSLDAGRANCRFSFQKEAYDQRCLFWLQSLQPNAMSQSDTICMCLSTGRITRTQIEMSEMGSSGTL